MTGRSTAGAGTERRTPEPLLEVEELEVQFATERGWTTVVDRVSFAVRPGEIVGLVGESGAGKSVTVLSILRLIPRRGARISHGRILFDGRDLLEMTDRDLQRIRGNRIGMIFQEPMTSLNPLFTVGEQIAETVRQHQGATRTAAWRRAEELLALVGIPSAARRAHDYPHSFSGGMRQRAMIAMALACDPELLLADEPTTALDVTVQANILQLLRDLQTRFRMAVIFVSHDLGVIAELCERVLVMYAGQVVEEARADDLFRRPMHPYSMGLMRSATRSVSGERMWTIPGSAAMGGSWPSGCRFHPRCPHCDVSRCTAAPIELESIDGRLVRCVRATELDVVQLESSES
jgi:oligopeptide/dipeptide ABC transporter ATP-binding protein